MSLGSEIARLRYEKGLRQKELAAKIGVRADHLLRWEKDYNRPRKAMLEKIAEALDVPVKTLLSAAESQELGGYLLQERDPELVQMLGEVHILSDEDLGILKAFVEAMLTKTQMYELLRGKSQEERKPLISVLRRKPAAPQDPIRKRKTTAAR